MVCKACVAPIIESIMASVGTRIGTGGHLRSGYTNMSRVQLLGSAMRCHRMAGF